MSKTNPLVLMILDGWGYREETAYNAIATAHTPHWDEWWRIYPHTLLKASGCCVGLPEEQMGNSEVGHMHIGAGRIILQDFSRINQAQVNGEFAKNPVFINAIKETKQQNHSLHILGLLSPGGVHSHENHLLGFLELCAQHDLKKIYLHLFLDGRDTPPQSALSSLQRLEAYLKQNPGPVISSLSGRYYAMDRDHRWERVQLVYRLLTEGTSDYQFDDPTLAIQYFYGKGITDEFIPPTRIGSGSTIHDQDSVLFFNYRADRARQLTEAFVLDSFTGFTRPIHPQLTRFISMTQYANYLDTTIAFPPLLPQDTLGGIIAQHGLRQLRLAETEKYAHVTFFFNGGSERIFPGEERLLIPSPKVATYDLKPEMSAAELTAALVQAITSQAYDVIICNYANADMVGHTGQFAATMQAIEYLDQCMQVVVEAVAQVNGKLLITADHGNAEFMFNEKTAQSHTAHTSQPVPLLYVGEGWEFNSSYGSLIDIAPTILTLLGIPIPTTMTGQPLLVKKHA